MVSAMVVVVWLLTAAFQIPRLNMDAMFCHQYVRRLNPLTRKRRRRASELTWVMACHAAE
jgi:hypothetical protein